MIHSFDDLNALIVIAIFYLLASILMVSKIKYNSFKDLRALNRMPFNGALLIPLIFILIIMDAPNVLSLLSIIYLVSGLFFAFLEVFRKQIGKKESKASE